LLMLWDEKKKTLATAKEADLDVSWLSMFNRGKITEPSVNKVQKLYEYLSKSKLKI